LIALSSGEHVHTLLVTPDEIKDGKDVTILSSSTQGHAHFVHLTPDDFAELERGMTIYKKSCAGPDHEWALVCNLSVTPTPGLPMCTDECGDGTDSTLACD